MEDHYNHNMYLATKFIINLLSLILLITLPQSNCQFSAQNETKYSVCEQSFNCGSLSSLSYPFSGNNNPTYCGIFYLQCRPSSQYVSIEIGSQNFEVLDINTKNNTMTLVRQDQINDVCSRSLTNVSLSTLLFSYTETVKSVTVFYDCPPGASIGRNNFTCQNDGSFNSFYVDVDEALLEQFPGLGECESSTLIEAPSMQGVPDLDLSSNSNSIEAYLKNALNGAFEVKYSTGGYKCTRCQESDGICGTSETSQDQFSCFCPLGSDDSEVCHFLDTDNPYLWKKKLVTGIAITAMAALLICFIICCNRRKPSMMHVKFWLTAQSNRDIEAFLEKQGVLAIKRYKFSDVKKITESFKVKLGQGGFGAVYKGQLLNGFPVAVKILNQSKGNGEDFINEVASISRTSHVNVVTLLGFCFERHNKVLIYEFMANGSLETFIFKRGTQTTQSLSWDNLFQIALGIARGLQYLHKGCRTQILHFDIKPHNILLDENFCPKISDFGLAKLCPRKESIISMSDARGTMGYVAPEVWNRHFGGVSHKSDVYSYGMMLLEMVGGRKNIIADASHTSEIYFPHWIYKRLETDGNVGLDGLVAEEENEIAKKMTMVGLWCVQTIPNCRPTMSTVIEMLEGCVSSLEMPPKPVLSSPSRSAAESSLTSISVAESFTSPN